MGHELLRGLNRLTVSFSGSIEGADCHSMATFEGRFTDVQGLRIAVVIARFNDLVTGKLLSGCLDCLSRHGVNTSGESDQLDVAWVPGSLELPVVAQQLARSGRYQVLITLGAVIRGDTPFRCGGVGGQ